LSPRNLASWQEGLAGNQRKPVSVSVSPRQFQARRHLGGTKRETKRDAISAVLSPGLEKTDLLPKILRLDHRLPEQPLELTRRFR